MTNYIHYTSWPKHIYDICCTTINIRFFDPLLSPYPPSRTPLDFLQVVEEPNISPIVKELIGYDPQDVEE